MPNIVDGGGASERFYENVERSFDQDMYVDRYDDLDLKPGSDFHRDMANRVMTRARAGRNAVKEREDEWRRIDNSLNVFIRPDKDEIKERVKNPNRPVSFVIPATYAALESLLAYYSSVDLQEPLYTYNPVESGDALGAAMLEHVVLQQCRKSKTMLNHYIVHRDSLSYGFGLAAPRWATRYRFKTIKRPVGMFSSLFRNFINLDEVEERERVVAYEGNEVDNISVYRCLPDPDHSIHNIQRMQFFGWIERTDYMSLLERERDNDEYFNVRFLKGRKDGRSKLLRTEDYQHDKIQSGDQRNNSVTSPVDVVHMMVKIIPEDWKAGDEEYPVKYIISVAADDTIIRFKDMGLDHDMFPVAVSAPEFDGYSVTPLAKLEVTQPIQEALSWFINNRVADVIKNMHGMWLFDPNLVNIKDVMKPGPGKYIRLKRAAWGKGIQDAIEQLKVQDVTQNNVNDAILFMNMIQQSLGIDLVQTVRRNTSERVSATEARGDSSAVISKVAKMVKIASLQFTYDMSYLFATHTQQFMTRETYINTVGRLQDLFSAIYPTQQVPVTPADINVDFDINVADGNSPGAENIESMTRFFQVALADPRMSQLIDVPRLFLAVARASGFKNVYEFMRTGQGLAGQVADQSFIDSQVQQGNLVTPDQLIGGSNGAV